jgi:hypothetical protein
MRLGISIFVLCHSCVTMGAQALPTIKLAGPSRSLTLDGGLFQAESQAMPKWERGHVLTFDRDRSIVMAADRSGKVVLRAHISPHQASHVILHDLSVSPSGTFAVAFSAISSDGGPAGFIAWLDHTGSTAQLVQVSSGFPHLVCFADDGSLWAAVWTGTAYVAEAVSYDLLRHYDASGKLIRSALPRQTFPAGQFPAENGSLKASRDRIGFFARDSRIWVELTYTGEGLGHWVVPGKAEFSWAFLSQSNDVYIHQQERIDSFTETLKSYRFDKSSSSLQELDTSAINEGHPARLLGVDGEEMVYRTSKSPQLLKWSTYNVPAIHLQSERTEKDMRLNPRAFAIPLLVVVLTSGGSRSLGVRDVTFTSIANERGDRLDAAFAGISPNP